MKRSAIYLKAAEKMDGGYELGICGMFCGLHKDGHLGATCNGTRRIFVDLFMPVATDDSERGYWWGSPPAGRAERVIALCFMAAIAERDERKQRRR